jgi:hypothetical protein
MKDSIRPTHYITFPPNLEIIRIYIKPSMISTLRRIAGLLPGLINKLKQRQ